MKYFLDCEFQENGPKFPIELISIAMVAEDGREFYAINSEFDWENASDWLKEHVMPQVTFKGEEIIGSGASPRRRWEESRRMPFKQIKQEILAFVGDDKPEVWGYYSDYDWVVFCQIFGAMINLPKGWPMFCMDLKQLCVERGNPRLPNMPSCIEHHALYDARETKYRYDWLMLKTKER
jgi:hypothetical protein